MSRRPVNAIARILLGTLVLCFAVACATAPSGETRTEDMVPASPAAEIELSVGEVSAGDASVGDGSDSAPVEPASASIAIRRPASSPRPIPPGQFVLPTPIVDESIAVNRPTARIAASETTGFHEPVVPETIPEAEDDQPVAMPSALATGPERAPAVRRFASLEPATTTQPQEATPPAPTARPVGATQATTTTPPAQSAVPADSGRTTADAAVPDAQWAPREPTIAIDPAPIALRTGVVESAPVDEVPAVVETLNPEPVWSNRQGSVDSLADVRIVLPGSGWLYVGREASDGVPRLLGKDSGGTDDTFEFTLSEDGLYRLWFQHQDPVTGALRNERLLLTASSQVGSNPSSASIVVSHLPVRSEGETDSTVLRPGSSAGAPAYIAPNGTGDVAIPLGFVESGFSAPTPTMTAVTNVEPDGPDYTNAQGLAIAGDPASALRSFLAETQLHGTPDDPALIFEIADVASAAGNRTVAREYWRLVADQGGRSGADALRRLWGDSLAHDDDERIVTDLAAMASAGEAVPQDHLVAATQLDLLGAPAQAIEQFDAYLALAPRFADDEIYFRLAQLLEMPTDHRDLRRAVGLYERIVGDFPLSAHWEESESRIEYLNRHYFDVR